MKEEVKEKLRREYKGRRVELVEMADEAFAPPAGTQGTVVNIVDAGDMWVAWDNGSGLKLIPGIDKFRKVCPKCGYGYDGYPALSREDNKTEICPLCGVREAMAAASNIFPKRRNNG